MTPQLVLSDVACRACLLKLDGRRLRSRWTAVRRLGSQREAWTMQTVKRRCCRVGGSASSLLADRPHRLSLRAGPQQTRSLTSSLATSSVLQVSRALRGRSATPTAPRSSRTPRSSTRATSEFTDSLGRTRCPAGQTNYVRTAAASKQRSRWRVGPSRMPFAGGSGREGAALQHGVAPSLSKIGKRVLIAEPAPRRMRVWTMRRRLSATRQIPGRHVEACLRTRTSRKRIFNALLSAIPGPAGCSP